MTDVSPCNAGPVWTILWRKISYCLFNPRGLPMKRTARDPADVGQIHRLWWGPAPGGSVLAAITAQSAAQQGHRSLTAHQRWAARLTLAKAGRPGKERILGPSASTGTGA